MQFCAYHMAILASKDFQKQLVISGYSQLASLQTNTTLTARIS